MKLARALTLFLSLASTTRAPAQDKGVWLDVPFVAKSEDGCGSAAISMLLQYWSAHGLAVDAERSDVNLIQRRLYSRAAHGIYASALEKYVRDSGFTVFALNGTWDDLDTHLKQGRPLILGTAPNGKKGPLHYIVAVGLDRQAPAVLVNDPARGKLMRIDRTDFEKQWQPAGNWTLLAVPQQAK